MFKILHRQNYIIKYSVSNEFMNLVTKVFIQGVSEIKEFIQRDNRAYANKQFLLSNLRSKMSRNYLFC